MTDRVQILDATPRPSLAELRLSPEGLLRLLHIASPGLPIGAYAYSHGLEQAVENGWVRDAASSCDWIRGVLECSLGACDLPVFARLYQAFARGDLAGARRWNRWLGATRSTTELQNEDRQLGGALARVLVSLGIREAKTWADDACATHACLFALAAVSWEIPLEAAGVAFLFSWLEAQVSAAVRLVPLGQTEGQRILLDLSVSVIAAVRGGLARTDDDIGGGIVGHATSSALHETQYSRLFRS